MPPLFQRFIGIVLIIGATAGLIFNIAGLFLMPRLSEGVRQQTLGTLSRLNETLITIEEGLVVVDNSLDNAGNTLDAVEITIRGVAEGIEETAPLLETMTALTGQDLPEIVANTQDSLAVAEQGAQGIEIVLGSFNSIFPLINIPYNPDVPLYQSLSNISKSLSPLVDSFVEIEKSINIAGDNLQQVSDDTITVADNLAEIDQNITDAKDVIDQFEEAVKEQKEIIISFESDANSAISWGSWAISMILFWLIIAELGLLSQGFEMVQRSWQEKSS